MVLPIKGKKQFARGFFQGCYADSDSAESSTCMIRIPFSISKGGKKVQIPILFLSNKYYSDANSDSDSDSHSAES